MILSNLFNPLTIYKVEKKNKDIHSSLIIVVLFIAAKHTTGNLVNKVLI